MQNNPDDKMAAAVSLLNNESSLGVGIIYPDNNEEFLAQKSLVIRLAGQPILMMMREGFTSFNEIEQTALRLISSREFCAIVAHTFEVAIDLDVQYLDLSLDIATNREVLQDESGNIADRYFTIITSKNYHEGEGISKAIPLLDDPENMSFCFGLCVSNETVKAFLPDAKNMSQTLVPVPLSPYTPTDNR